MLGVFFSHSLEVLFSDGVSLTEPGTHRFNEAVWTASLRNLPVSAFYVWDYGSLHSAQLRELVLYMGEVSMTGAGTQAVAVGKALKPLL